jgi:hypothetical protein
VFKDLLTDRRTNRRWSDEDQFVDYDRLVASIMDEIERRGIDQDFVPIATGSTIELLPNPMYRQGLAAEVVEVFFGHEMKAVEPKPSLRGALTGTDPIALPDGVCGTR